MRKISSRMVAMVVAVVMILTMMPQGAIAATEEQTSKFTMSTEMYHEYKDQLSMSDIMFNEKVNITITKLHTR